MGTTLSKAKQQIQFKPFMSHSTAPSESTKIEVSSSSPILSRPKTQSITKEIKEKKKKKNHRKYHYVGNNSVNKRSNKPPKYKKVTKSIIGKPTNFKHTGHMGAGDMMGADIMSLSMELNQIAKQVNNGFNNQTSPPPPVPPHLYISQSTRKRAAARSSVVPASFRRRQQRKAVPRHHPNLGLVNTLMIEIPKLRSTIRVSS
ncbi:uncharacterized protein BX664DRAFT_325038 [Halteromyces radiatus]|uniref:uncharacterized protein n=1 Tax=Halteromyces radiatus TaxID=101107 RepID=UPI00221EDB7E|nr:uncharacterized protein BX664DRAFT_325038 [Halteromyces radiatus]KAI8096853.1 hypothetical protein BX664DRAFT_325038 [Halteromyces radiatus]